MTTSTPRRSEPGSPPSTTPSTPLPPSDESTQHTPSAAASPAGGGTTRRPSTDVMRRQWLLPVVLLVVGNFMAVLDVTIVNVAVPSIQKDFGGSLDDVLWIATAYTLMLGIVVPLSSWLGDTFGLTRVYVASLAAFAVGSALCGMATNLPMLIAFRVLQAVPGGIMPVVAMTLVYRIVPPAKMGSAMGVYGLGVIFGPAVGPVLGGYFVQYLSWRLVFDVNVPVGVLGAVLAGILLPKATGRPGRRFDLPGFLCIALGLFAILLAASEGSEWGWDGYRVRMLLVGGVLALALFVVVELEVEQPLLELRVFSVRQFSFSMVALMVVQINLLAVAFFLPVFLQQGQQKEAFDAGILMLPSALVTGSLSPFVGRLYDRIGPRVLGVVGMVLMAYGTWMMTAITADMTREDVLLWTCVRGAGLGLSFVPIMTAGLSALPGPLTHVGSAWNNVARQCGGALGLAVLQAISTSQQAQLLADRGAVLGGAASTVTQRSSDGRLGSLYARFLHLNAEVLATSYGNLFLLTAAVSGVGVLLAALLRRPAGPETR